ncbi:MAG: hypothetical protein ABIJ09_13900 [Pseudomonadota bacterium]
MPRRRTIRILGLGDWLEHQTDLDPMPPTLDRYSERLRQRELWQIRRVEGALGDRVGVPYAIEFTSTDLEQRAQAGFDLDSFPIPDADDLSWLRSLATA